MFSYLDFGSGNLIQSYKNAPKKQKGLILQEFCLNCGDCRKYAIRILNCIVEPRLAKPGPKRKYGPQFIEILHKPWQAMEFPCSKKMKVAMPLWLDFVKNLDMATQV